MTLGSRLLKARNEKGYSLRDVESLTGVSPSTISKAERDVGDLLTSHLVKLAECYGVTIDSLVGNDALSLRADTATIRRAVLMCDLQDIADGLSDGTDEDREIAHLIRCLWVAIHQTRTAELSALITDVVYAWTETPTQ